MMNALFLASQNKGKYREFAEKLATVNISLSALDVQVGHDVVETGSTFIENALIKAKYFAQYTNLPVLADDSGLVVPALGGKPGVHSARFAGEQASDSDNIAKLLITMGGNKNRQALFYCCLVCLRYVDDPMPLISVGCWQGKILEKPIGQGGFGYDPVFWIPELEKTAAELDLPTKNKISHRGRALDNLLNKLKANFVFHDAIA